MSEQPKDRPDPTPGSARTPEPRPLPEPENPVLSAGKFASDQTAASVIAYLITGPALFGWFGWLADRWLGTSFLVAIGILGGMAMSLYVIWLRYGTQ